MATGDPSERQRVIIELIEPSHHDDDSRNPETRLELPARAGTRSRPAARIRSAAV